MSHQAHYTATAQTLHGVIALLIITLLAIGLYMADLEPSPGKWQLYALHKEFGITILALVILRILWRGTHTPPRPLASHARWEVTLARVVHALLYLGMLTMPISGYVMSSAGGHDISFFGLFNLPLWVEKNETIGTAALTVHSFAAYALMAGIALHFIGAIKHHVIDRDATLARMFGFIRTR